MLLELGQEHRRVAGVPRVRNTPLYHLSGALLCSTCQEQSCESHVRNTTVLQLSINYLLPHGWNTPVPCGWDTNNPGRQMNNPGRQVNNPGRQVNNPVRQLSTTVRQLSNPVWQVSNPLRQLINLVWQLNQSLE